MSLEDCIRLAQAAQSVVSIAQRQVEIAHYGITQARANFLPQAAVGNSVGYNSPLAYDHSRFSYIAANAIREYSTLANIGVELDTSGRLRAQLARARADRDAANAELVLSRRDLKLAVSVSYYRLLLARHLVDAARSNLSEAQAFEGRSRLLAQNGEVAQADVIKASAQVAFFEQAVGEAELEAGLANHELASFWTVDVESPLNLVDSLAEPPPVPAPAFAGTPYLRRLEFQVFDAQRRGFQADASRMRAELLPQLSLVTQYGFDSDRVSFSDRGYAAFVHLNIPVFDWFRARSAARQFDLQARQVDANRQIAERTYSKEYRDALARVRAMYSQVSITTRQVALSEDNLRLSRVRYEGGEGPAIEVVQAQNQLAQARTNYYAAKANYLNARAGLEVASGQ